MQLHSNSAFQKKKRYFFWSAFSILCYYFYNSVLLSQLSQPTPPPLIFPSIDVSYWILLSTGIYHFVISNAVVATIFDITLLSLPLLILILPEKRWLFIVFFVFTTFYFMAQNVVAGHHFHSFVGVVFLAFIFCFSGKRFDYLWQAARYYTLFVFVSAALWKISRGFVFEPQQMENILKAQHAQFLLEQPNSLHASFVRWLIQQLFARVLLMAVVLVQLFFVVGFFTRKADSILIVLAVLFVVFNYAVMRIVSFEILVLILTLISNSFWEKEADKSATLQSDFSNSPTTQ